MTSRAMMLLTLIACGNPPPSEPAAVDSKTSAAARERLDLVKRAAAAFPRAVERLPACTPGPDIKLLSLATADHLTGGKGSAAIPGFARPQKDEWHFSDLSTNPERGVRNLSSLRGLALFAADSVTAPVGSSEGLITRPSIKGRVVVFDLSAKPTCMSQIEVTGADATSVYVKKGARDDQVKRKFEHDAEEGIRDQLTKAIEALVKTVER